MVLGLWLVVCSLWLSVYSSGEIASSIFHRHSIHRSDLLSLGGRLRVRHSPHSFPVRVLSIQRPFKTYERQFVFFFHGIGRIETYRTNPSGCFPCLRSNRPVRHQCHSVPFSVGDHVRKHETVFAVKRTSLLREEQPPFATSTQTFRPVTV